LGDRTISDSNPWRDIPAYWSRPAAELLRELASGPAGLSDAAARDRLESCGPNELAASTQAGPIRLLAARFRSPLLLILIFAALVSILVREWVDALVVLGIVIVSAVLSSLQEYRASNAVERLRRRVSVTVTVRRDGAPRTVAGAEVVPGDIVLLSAGCLVPADGILLEARDCFLSQALLTGETFPVEKRPGIAAADADLAARDNCVFKGTSVRSGTATVLVVTTGRNTEFGRIGGALLAPPPETEFERGLRRFGGLLLEIMTLVVLVVLAVNILLQRPTIDTLLFAVALAVGLSPELLPAILAVTLARGAQAMAARGVIVKRPNAIENLGGMDVLCTDKTGTLTEGVVRLQRAADADGRDDGEVLRLGYLNSRLQTGLANPLDEAVVARGRDAGLSDEGVSKRDEIPYDFVRKRLSVVVEEAGAAPRMITKGALDPVLEVCTQVRRDGRGDTLDDAARLSIRRRFEDWSAQGYRVLGLASRTLPPQPAYGREDEAGMIFEGYLLFFDPPRQEVARTLERLRHLGVRIKIVTGDNRFIARHVAEAVGLRVGRIVTGTELTAMKDEALWHLAPRVTVFAEVDPNQKERLILALQKAGHVVGYLGDGINDAPALHAADAGISVDGATDVAKEAADFVLLEHDLDVVCRGIDEGRRTFANTLKYVFITTSANFGNMASMAAASFFLPFLPLLAKQVLLNNFLSDIPAIGIAGDNVDREWERTPHRWDLGLLRNFMITFGLVSTLFDLITFAALWTLVGDRPGLFRTGWFVESLITELCIVFVIRTYRPLHRSRPGRLLVWSTLPIAALTLVLPYTPAGALFDLEPLPGAVLAAVLAISLLYIVVSEYTKRGFYRRFH
jgi:Mg2+-importing ATPase